MRLMEKMALCVCLFFIGAMAFGENTDALQSAGVTETIDTAAAAVQVSQEPLPTSEPLTWQQAMERVGEEVVVEARIVGVHDPETRGQGGPVSLNTDRDFRSSLSIVFYKKDRAGVDQGFGDPSRFNNQMVRVRGKVSDYKGRKQIKLRSPSDIEILDAPASAPATAEPVQQKPLSTSGPLTWQQAMERVGEEVVVEARIVNVFDPETREQGGPVRLNTDRDFRSSLTFAFYKKDRAGVDQGFGDPNRFRNQLVRVRGRVNDYKGSKQIMLRAPADIEILESAVTVMSPADAMSRVGEVVTVQGQIVNVFIPEQGPSRLNFDRDYRRSLNLVIFNREKFGSLRANYLNKTVRVTGTVGTYRDQVQIRVDDPSQIEVVE